METSNPENWLGQRRSRKWKWLLMGVLMLLLQFAFIAWLALNFNYLSGLWEIILSLEGSALQVSPGQRLSLMMPLWLAAGTITYSLAMLAMFRVYRLEKRYQRVLQARLKAD